jgi:hypothetical protein
MFKRIIAISLVALLFASLASATNYKTVPKPVTEFYADVMGMFSTMLKGMNLAKEPHAVAVALNQATKTATDKKLSGRYKALAKQYPEFFATSDEPDTSWIPPADWVQINTEFNQQMMDYAANAGNLMSSMGTPEVVDALEKFGAIMEGFSTEE